MAPKRKRAWLTPPEAKKIEINPDDYLSSLPNDVLVTILSHLSVKEAGATSVLSSLWENLWTYVRELKFEANETLDRIAADPRVKVSERPKYINWVNRVVRKYRGVTLDNFKISFDLDKSSKSALDNWIKFAIRRRVQCLEVELLENGEVLRDPNNSYTIPYKQLTQSRGVSFRNVNSFHNQVQPCLSTGLKFLNAMALKSVNVSDEALDAFFSSCPNLRLLSIHGSGDLRNVRISGFTIGLKYLELVYCMGMKSIEISNVNLISFNYLGTRIDLFISNVPMLNEVSVGVGYAGLANNVFDQLSCCLYQLGNLTLDIYHPTGDVTVYDFPWLPNLKQLILKLGAWDDECLLDFASLIKRCPHLVRFVMQLIWMTPTKKRRKLREAPRSPHECIETVEIVGYFGRMSDAEVAMYCIQNCVALKRITIDPRSQIMERAPLGNDRIKKEEAGRKSARKQLENKIPHGVKLIIL